MINKGRFAQFFDLGGVGENDPDLNGDYSVVFQFAGILTPRRIRVTKITYFAQMPAGGTFTPPGYATGGVPLSPGFVFGTLPGGFPEQLMCDGFVINNADWRFFGNTKSEFNDTFTSGGDWMAIERRYWAGKGNEFYVPPSSLFGVFLNDDFSLLTKHRFLAEGWVAD